MPFSSGLSPQMKMLTAQQQSDIMNDYAQSPDASGPPPSINMLNNGVRISGPIFAGDEAASPATVGPLTRAQAMDTLGVAPPPPAEQEPQGPLSRTTLPRQAPPDIAELLKQYMPQDDSQSRYMALAAGLLAPTKTGSFGEQLGNVASAMQTQRAEQDKMRAHYVPLIMQQVAQQQAREEQNAYRLEAQQQAQAAQAQAARIAQQSRNDMALQAQQARADQAALYQRSMDERAAADRASREAIATDRIQAGRDANPVTPATNPTPILGVPVPRVLPWANQSNAKDADKVRLAEVTRGTKEVEADSDSAKKAQALAQEAARFQALNAQTGTGGVSDRIPGGQWVQSFGDNYNEMQAISARLTPSMREAGSGATSDFDARMFQRGTVGVDKPREVNDAIAAGLIKRAKQAQDYADFRSTYLEQNGTLTGANEHWNKYVKAHPIFDPAKPNAPTLNAGYIEWRDYFGKATGATPPATNPAAPTPAATDLAAAARAEQARRNKGAK